MGNVAILQQIIQDGNFFALNKEREIEKIKAKQRQIRKPESAVENFPQQNDKGTKSRDNAAEGLDKSGKSRTLPLSSGGEKNLILSSVEGLDKHHKGKIDAIKPSST